jgi:hypothetical protein
MRKAFEILPYLQPLRTTSFQPTLQFETLLKPDARDKMQMSRRSNLNRSIDWVASHPHITLVFPLTVNVHERVVSNCTFCYTVS